MKSGVPLKVTGDTKTDAIWERVEPWLAAEHLELDDLEVKGSGPGRVVRVLVDSEGGIDIDRLAEVSEGVSRLLDDLPGFDSSYQLEVSSPGLERVLRRPRHFEKSVGREVSIKAKRGEETVVIRGALVRADDSGFVVTQGDESTEFAYDDVISAKTLFKWEKSPKPGKK